MDVGEVKEAAFGPLDDVLPVFAPVELQVSISEDPVLDWVFEDPVLEWGFELALLELELPMITTPVPFDEVDSCLEIELIKLTLEILVCVELFDPVLLAVLVEAPGVKLLSGLLVPFKAPRFC